LAPGCSTLDETLFLSDADKVHHSMRGRSVLIQPAESCGDRAVGVVLTGGNCDGHDWAIKAAGDT